MSDRLLVELVLIPMLMHDVAVQGIRVSDDVGGFFKLTGLLDEAMREPIAHLPLKDQGKIVRRAQRARDICNAEVRFADTLGLVTYHIMRELTDCGYLEIGQASPLWQAAQIFMASLEDAANRGEQLEEAEVRAADVMRRLRAERLFERVDRLAA